MKRLSFQENAVSAKVHALFGRMLTPVQYNELMHCHNIPEICTYLREKTTYRDTLAGVQDSTIHRGQLEMLLAKDAFYQYEKLVRYVPGQKGVYRYIILNLEVRTVLSCIRNIISGSRMEFIAEIPVFIQPYISLRLSDLAQVDTLEQLAQVLDGTAYGPVMSGCMKKQAGDDVAQYSRFEVAFHTFYFKRILLLISQNTAGLSQKRLEHLVKVRAELMNVSHIYRMKRFYQIPTEQIRELVLPFYDILSPKIMEELIESADADAFLERLKKTRFGAYIQDDQEDVSAQVQLMLYHMQMRLMRFSSNPRVLFMAFMSLREMERDNIVRIIEGVRYGLPAEEITGLLYH